MTIPKSPQSIREKRRAVRSSQRRSQVILISILGIALVAALAFLAYNNRKPAAPDFTAYASITGLQMEDLQVGTGAEAQTGNTVVVHYTGWLLDGTKFDSSIDRNDPFEFVLGAGEVIQGWDQGVVGMKVGGKRRLAIPPDMAYGTSGAGGVIPANAVLVFEVELLEVK